MAQYRCTNFGNCDFADSKRVFSATDLPPVCPGCGSSESVLEVPSRRGLSVWLISSIGLIVILSTVSFLLPLDMDSMAPPMTELSPPKHILRESAVDRVLNQLNLGNIAFIVPHTMEMDKTENIQLVLSLDQSIEELKSTIQASGIKEGANIKVSDRMEASLTGLAFDIVPVTPKELRPDRMNKKGRKILLSIVSAFFFYGAPLRRCVRHSFCISRNLACTIGRRFFVSRNVKGKALA